MTLIDFCVQRFQYRDGADQGGELDEHGEIANPVRGGLQIRPKTANTLRIFGSGKAKALAEWKTLSEAIQDVLAQARREVGSCTRHDVVGACHVAAERQFKADAVARRNR